jgi:hypothetical protein
MSKKSSMGKVAAGFGVAALAAGAAAAYYLTGEGAKKHQKEIKGWAKKAKAEIAHKLKDAEKLSKTAYEQALEQVMAKYKQAKNIDPQELAAFGKELKGHWDDISKHALKLATGKKKSPARVKKNAKKS